MEGAISPSHGNLNVARSGFDPVKFTVKARAKRKSPGPLGPGLSNPFLRPAPAGEAQDQRLACRRSTVAVMRSFRGFSVSFTEADTVSDQRFSSVR